MSCLDMWIFYRWEITLASSERGGKEGKKYNSWLCTTLLKQKYQFSASLLWIVICKQHTLLSNAWIMTIITQRYLIILPQFYWNAKNGVNFPTCCSRSHMFKSPLYWSWALSVFWNGTGLLKCMVRVASTSLPCPGHMTFPLTVTVMQWVTDDVTSSWWSPVACSLLPCLCCMSH